MTRKGDEFQKKFFLFENCIFGTGLHQEYE